MPLLTFQTSGKAIEVANYANLLKSIDSVTSSPEL